MLSKEVTGYNEEFPEKSCGRHFNDIEHERECIDTSRAEKLKEHCLCS